MKKRKILKNGRIEISRIRYENKQIKKIIMRLLDLTEKQINDIGLKDSDFGRPIISLDDLSMFNNYNISKRYQVELYENNYYTENCEYVIEFDGIILKPYRSKSNDSGFCFADNGR